MLKINFEIWNKDMEERIFKGEVNEIFISTVGKGYIAYCMYEETSKELIKNWNYIFDSRNYHFFIKENILKSYLKIYNKDMTDKIFEGEIDEMTIITTDTDKSFPDGCFGIVNYTYNTGEKVKNWTNFPKSKDYHFIIK